MPCSLACLGKEENKKEIDKINEMKQGRD